VRAAALLLASVALLAAPAAAPAATLDPLEPCYVAAARGQTERVHFGGSGFTPDARLDIAVDGVVVSADVPVMLDGTLPPGDVPAPFIREGQRRFTVTATEQHSGIVAWAASRVTALDLELHPSRARPSSRVTFHGRGFTDPGPVFGHYLFKRKVRKTVRLARPRGRCGHFRVRRLQLPMRRPRVGTWTLQADQHRRYRWPPATTAYRIRIVVRRMAGRETAIAPPAARRRGFPAPSLGTGSPAIASR
jgi:hypothetical protein